MAEIILTGDALEQLRHLPPALGREINPDYAQMATDRIAAATP